MIAQRAELRGQLARAVAMEFEGLWDEVAGSQDGEGGRATGTGLDAGGGP